MSYGTIKVDTITFTDGGVDKSVSVSGLTQNPTFSGNLIVTGTISGVLVQGQTVSGATVTGDAGVFTTVTGGSAGFTTVTGTTVTGTTANFNAGTFTSQVSGATVTGNLAQFTTLTGGTAGFTTVTGATVTGTTANFVTVSGTTVTGNAGQFTTITGTSAGFTTITGATVTGTVGNFGSGSAAAPSVSVGTTDNGIYSPGTDQVALSTNGTQRINIEADGDINIDNGGVFYDATNNRLGIGTTSPDAALHISNSVAEIRLTDSDGDGDYANIISGATGNLFLSADAGNGGANSFMSFQVDNSEKARIDSSGRLLVGTSSAYDTNAISNAITSYNQVAGSSIAAASTLNTYWANNVTGSAVNQLAKSRGALGIHTIVQSGDRIGAYSFAGSDGSSFIESARIEAFIDGTPGANDMPGRLVFSVTADGASSPTERMRIDSSGRVGIGTTSPTELLSLSQDVTTEANLLSLVGTSFADGEKIFATFKRGAVNLARVGAEVGGAGTTGQLIFETASSSTSTERARIDSSGRLLVGTSSASGVALLQVLGYSGAATDAGVIQLTRGSDALVAGNELGSINFGDTIASATQRATIKGVADGTGGVGDLPTRLVFSTTADGASSPTEAMTIDRNGRIITLPTYNATSANAANVGITATGFLFRSTSSIKYKTNVETLKDEYADAILNCRPVWYRSTSGDDNPNWGWWGFIAEEVAEIDPRLVFWKTHETTTDQEGNTTSTELKTPIAEGVQYDRFVPHLLNLVKRQQQAIETLEAKVAALESA